MVTFWGLNFILLVSKAEAKCGTSRDAVDSGLKTGSNFYFKVQAEDGR